MEIKDEVFVREKQKLDELRAHRDEARNAFHAKVVESAQKFMELTRPYRPGSELPPLENVESHIRAVDEPAQDSAKLYTLWERYDAEIEACARNLESMAEALGYSVIVV